jgi:hypothetical protein
MTGSLLRALVTRNRWLLARPAARATGLASRWSWSFLERACHADRLVLGTSGSSRYWSRSALVSTGSALVALGPFLSALVTRTGWFSARPAARATGLAPRWSLLVLRLSQSLVSWWLVLRSRVLASAAHFLSATARSPRARIPLEFGCSRQFHTRGCIVLTVPRVR